MTGTAEDRAKNRRQFQAMRDRAERIQSMIAALRETRKTLDPLKEAKIALSWEKHGDFRQWSPFEIFTAFCKETKEVFDAFHAWLDPDDEVDAPALRERVREEIVDCINTLEMLFHDFEEKKP